ncbi:unnamed protein product [Dimorphilus gyrociliatus]|uniref:Uncharacterized protein n=1 Tax=Dimorphilus gyrociliatus TaxID=2664684 RepID=A0A7I8VMX5_9ANNE|nr:unnamed protein product [Dimorphilus gyrociliatus]
MDNTLKQSIVELQEAFAMANRENRRIKDMNENLISNLSSNLSKTDLLKAELESTKKLNEGLKSEVENIDHLIKEKQKTNNELIHEMKNMAYSHKVLDDMKEVATELDNYTRGELSYVNCLLGTMEKYQEDLKNDNDDAAVNLFSIFSKEIDLDVRMYKLLNETSQSEINESR